MSSSSIPMANIRKSMSKLHKFSPVTPRRSSNRESGRFFLRVSPPRTHETDMSDNDAFSEEHIPWCNTNCRRNYKFACCAGFLALAIISIIVLIVYYQTHEFPQTVKKPLDRSRFPSLVEIITLTNSRLSSEATSTKANDDPRFRNYGSDDRSSRNTTTTAPFAEIATLSQKRNATEKFTEATSTSSATTESLEKKTEFSKNATATGSFTELTSVASRLDLTEDSENARLATTAVTSPAKNRSFDNITSVSDWETSKPLDHGPRNWSESSNTSTNMDSLLVQQRKFDDETKDRGSSTEMNPPENQEPRNFQRFGNTVANLDLVANDFNYSTVLNYSTTSRPSQSTLSENHIDFDLDLTINDPSSAVLQLNTFNRTLATTSKLDKNSSSVEDIREVLPSRIMNISSLDNTSYTEQNVTDLGSNATEPSNTENSTTADRSSHFLNLTSTTPPTFETSQNSSQSSAFYTNRYVEQNVTSVNLNFSHLNFTGFVKTTTDSDNNSTSYKDVTNLKTTESVFNDGNSTFFNNISTTNSLNVVNSTISTVISEGTESPRISSSPNVTNSSILTNATTESELANLIVY